MRDQNIDFIRHGLVQLASRCSFAMKCHCMKGGVQGERVIKQNMNTRTEQSESRLQINFEAFIVIAGNDDRVLRPIG